MRKKLFLSTIFLCAFVCATAAPSLQNSTKPETINEWIAKSLQEIQTIKVGDTRADLLKIFTDEGGISTALHQRFVYRKRPFIKVDVEFEAVGRAERDVDGRATQIRDSRDKIKSISKPYLEFSIID